MSLIVFEGIAKSLPSTTGQVIRFFGFKFEGIAKSLPSTTVSEDVSAPGQV